MNADHTDPAADRRHKRIRSFVRREGRLTPGQQRALDTLWPRFGLDYAPRVIDLDAVFGRRAPRILEIGFGNGDALAEMAAARPDADFLGIEVHRPGVGHLLRQIEQRELTNVRVACHDAVEVLRDMIVDGAFSRVHIFFPDPWPKKRHHKRRLIQVRFVELLARKMAADGVLHLATDWQPYAEHMLEVLSASDEFRNKASGSDLDTGCVPRPDSRPLTRFEQRGHRHGHDVWDLEFIRHCEAVL